jgi:HK97 family phage prohead protease
MEPHFSGYVTRYGIECSDGRTITGGAFKHQDGAKVPLVYQHNHTDIAQVLGHTILSSREDGIWGDSYLDLDFPNAVIAHALVKGGSIDKYSIWAKNLIERGNLVHSGDIQETSLVLAGANSGASIYNVLMHSSVDQDDLLIVGGEITHADTAVEDKPAAVEDKPAEEAPTEEPKPVGEVIDTLTDEQKLAVNAFIDDVVKEAVTEALTEEPNIEHDDLSSKKGTQMSRNAFDESSNASPSLPQLKHSDVTAILTAAKGNPSGGIKDFNESNAIGSLREFVRTPQGKELMHAAEYGVENIEILFPDAQALMTRPVFVDRRQDWVKAFMAGTSHSPFSRVKTFYADITADEARAKGYIKAHEKTEEVFPIFQRETGPTWVIKMQKLDRQDIIDITTFDIVAWMKVEMRGKLDEEIARAALFGDGRPTMVGGNMNPDKIKDPGAASVSGDGIRAIVNDHDLYTSRFDVPMPADPTGADWNILLDTVTEAGEHYLGSGNTTAFVSYRVATKLMTIRDDFGHRIYRNLSEVAGDMGVAKIQKVPTELMPSGTLAIVLDLSDYNFGTNRGGEVTLFDDFDIKFNQYLYLIETYLSGALTLPYSAQVFNSVESTDTLVEPQEPAFNEATNTVTVPTQTGVTWTRTDTGATVANGSTIVLDADDLPTVELEAHPVSGYYFGSDLDEVDSFTFNYVAP